MSTFVRGDVAVIRTPIKAADGSALAPGSVSVYFSYTNRSNVTTTSTVSATYSSTTDKWTALFDTTPVLANSTVYWTLESTSPLQGARDGEFYVRANPSNP